MLIFSLLSSIRSNFAVYSANPDSVEWISDFAPATAYITMHNETVMKPIKRVISVCCWVNRKTNEGFIDSRFSCNSRDWDILTTFRIMNIEQVWHETISESSLRWVVSSVYHMETLSLLLWRWTPEAERLQKATVSWGSRTDVLIRNCSDFEDTLLGDILLRWETILYTPKRHGNLSL